MLGEELLDLADDDDDEDARCEGLDLLAAACRMAPDHADRQLWWFKLGLGYSWRFLVTGEASDVQEAIDWYTRLRAEIPEGEARRVRLDARLANLYWQRFGLLYEPSYDDEVAYHCAVGAAAVQAATSIGALLPGAEGSDDGHPDVAFLWMLHGMALLRHFQANGEPSNLDTAIAELGAALQRPLEDTRWRGMAVGDLVHGCRLRAEAGGPNVAADLDLAITIGAAWLADTDPDERERAELDYDLAIVYQKRWHLSSPARRQ